MKYQEDEKSLQPSSWLKEMAKLSPSHWNYLRCLRTSFSIAFPMLLGYFTGTLPNMMWVSMGAMFPSMGERDAPYEFTFRKVIISAPIGAAGILIGYVNSWGIDWAWVVLIITFIAFFTAIFSSYSSIFSIGFLQFMAMAAVALGNPEIENYLLCFTLILCGSLFYLLIIYFEKKWMPHNVIKDAIVNTLIELVNLCKNKMNNKNIDSASDAYNEKYEALYKLMLQTRYQALGHNTSTDKIADIVQNIDNIFISLMAEEKISYLEKASINLKNLLSALQKDSIYFLSSGHEKPTEAINGLIIALWGKSAVSPKSMKITPSPLNIHLWLQKMAPGKTVVHSGIALSLCTALGYSARWVDQASHWYWIPMTVAIVMKPDLGSIFVRAVQRAVGTAAGVVLGGFLLALIPVGPIFILAIAAITFVIPWLSQKNYALTAFSITPLVLVLIDFISPAKNSLNYADLRLVDTLIGCSIVLIFGYMMWPHQHKNQLHQSMNTARLSIAKYLDLVLQYRKDPEAPLLISARRDAYGKLLDMRMDLQKSMAEPPPSGYEAAAWFPLVACAARLCDAITIYSASANINPDKNSILWLSQAPKALANLDSFPPYEFKKKFNENAEEKLISAILKEDNLRRRLYEKVNSVNSKI